MAAFGSSLFLAGSRRVQKIQIAPQPGITGALDRRMAEELAESLFGQLLPVRRTEVQYRRDRFERDLRRSLAEPVPGTHVLAGVAAEHPVPKFSFHRIGDQQLLQFDGV